MSCTSFIGFIDSPLSSPYTLSASQSFIPGLEPSFSANPFYRSLRFLFQNGLHGPPGMFTETSEHIRSYFLVFSHFSFWFREVD